MGDNSDGASRQDWKLDPSDDVPEPGQGKKALGTALSEAKGALASRGGKIVAVVPAAVALVVGLAVGSLSGGGGSTTVAGPAVTFTRTVTSAAQPGGNAGGAGSGTVAADSSSPDASASGSAGAGGFVSGPNGIGTVSLVNLTPVSGAFTSNDTSPVLNGKPQLLAISAYVGVDPYGHCNYQSGDVAYNLGRDYTQFSALIGVDDNSQSSTLAPTVEIDGDGLKLNVYTPTLGHPVQVTLNVSGVLRLDIKWSDPAANCTNAGYFVVGNGQLTTIPGYHPSPSASAAG